MVKQEGEGSSGGVGLSVGAGQLSTEMGKSRGSEHRCREGLEKWGLFIVHVWFLFSVKEEVKSSAGD